MMWATESERRERWLDTTLAPDEVDYFHEFGFVVRCLAYGTLDDGDQFVHLRFFDGEAVFEEHFSHREAHADAASYVAAMEETKRYTFEERLGPYGIEWQREQEERMAWR